MGLGGLRGIFLGFVIFEVEGGLLFLVLRFFLILDGFSGMEDGFFFEGFFIVFGIGFSGIIGWFVGVLDFWVGFECVLFFLLWGGYFFEVFMLGWGGIDGLFKIFVWFFGFGGLIGFIGLVGFVIDGGLEVWFNDVVLLFLGG